MAIKRRVTPNLAGKIRGSAAGGTCKKNYTNASILIFSDKRIYFFSSAHNHSQTTTLSSWTMMKWLMGKTAHGDWYLGAIIQLNGGYNTNLSRMI